MKQIDYKGLKKIRKKYHKKQKRICPILKIKIPLKDCVLDHAHSSNSKNLGVSEEAGLIRGVIHRQANTWEGKITNSFIRSGLHKMDIDLPTALRRLADYIENPPLIKKQLIHPSEQPKPKKLSKQWHNKLRKAYIKKYPNRKPIEFPKSKKITKHIEKLCKEFNMEAKFLK